MTALLIVLGLIALLLLILWTPVGIHAVYDQGVRLRIQAGILYLSVYPPKKAGKKEEVPGPPKKQVAPAEDKQTPGAKLPNRQQIAYTLETLVPALFRSMGRLGRRIQIPVLRLRAVFAGEDPAEVALLYGKAQAATASLLPLLEKMIRLKVTEIQFSTDYQAQHTTFFGEIRIKVRLGSLVALGCSMLLCLLSWLRGYRQLQSEKDDTKMGTAGASSAA